MPLFDKYRRVAYPFVEDFFGLRVVVHIAAAVQCGHFVDHRTAEVQFKRATAKLTRTINCNYRSSTDSAPSVTNLLSGIAANALELWNSNTLTQNDERNDGRWQNYRSAEKWG